MVNLYKFITARIKTVFAKVYPVSAASNVTFPYVVYNFPTVTDSSIRDDVMLEVDIWDTKRDGYDVLSGIEGLTSKVDGVLKNATNLDSDNVFIKIERVARLALKDPDENIYRRQLRYRIRVYDRK